MGIPPYIPTVVLCTCACGSSQLIDSVPTCGSLCVVVGDKISSQVELSASCGCV